MLDSFDNWNKHYSCWLILIQAIVCLACWILLDGFSAAIYGLGALAAMVASTDAVLQRVPAILQPFSTLAVDLAAAVTCYYIGTGLLGVAVVQDRSIENAKPVEGFLSDYGFELGEAEKGNDFVFALGDAIQMVGPFDPVYVVCSIAAAAAVLAIGSRWALSRRV